MNNRYKAIWALTVIILFAGGAYSATIHVPAGQPTIQAGIDAAVNGDTVLVAPGIYYENIKYNGKLIAIVADQGYEVTLLFQQSSLFPIVRFDGNENNSSILDGFTIGSSTNASNIYIYDSSPTIRNCIIENSFGSGIQISLGSPMINLNHIRNNRKCGIYIEMSSNAIIMDNEIIGNYSGEYFGGAGLYLKQCQNCSVIENTFMADTGRVYGGGIYIEGGGNNDVIANVILSCRAVSGGGICTKGSSANLIKRNVIIRNTALGGYGGGIEIESGTGTNIINNTIAFNQNTQTVKWGGGINFLGTQYDSLSNNIISFNTNGYGLFNEGSTFIYIDYCDIYGNTPGDINGLLVGDSVISGDPLYINSEVDDYRLQGDSPCIDAGNPTDPVPEFGGDRIDIGAIEYTGLILYFSLLSPDNQSISLTYTPTLQWEELPNNTEYGQLQYSLYLDTTANFANPIQYDAGTAATFTIPSNLPDYGRWHWKVKAFNDTATFWSNEIFTFRIDYIPTTPSIISPQNGDSVIAQDWLVWTESFDGDSDDTVTYYLQIDNNTDFSSPEVAEAGISAGPTPPGGQKSGAVVIQIQELQDFANLQDNTLYYWRVKAVDNFGGESAYSGGPTDFLYNPETTAPITPTAPSIVSPSNGEEATPETWLIWNESYDPDPNDTVFYSIQIDNNADFSSPEVVETGITDLAQPDKSIVGIVINLLQDYANLADDNTYYWRVKAVDKYGLESAFSDGTAYFMYNAVNSQPLPPTAGFAPGNEITTNNLLPTISWYPGTDPDPSDNSAALHYEIWIDDDGEFDTSIQFTYTTNPGVESVTLADSLTDETHWDYMVRTIDDQGLESFWSDMQHFWTNSRNDTPMVFQANYPDNLIVHNMLPEFGWEESLETDPMDSVYYKFYLATDPNFQFVNIIDSLWDITYARPDSLFFATQYWWKVKAIDNTGLTRFSSNIATFRTWRLGDVNNDWRFDILDVIFTIDYKFKNGAAPNPIYTGDVDANCVVNILDIIYMIDAKFKTGPDPLVGCE